MALPICPGTESRSIIVEVAAGGAALPATAGDTATDAGGVCGIGDAIIMCNIFVVIVMTAIHIKLSESNKKYPSRFITIILLKIWFLLTACYGGISTHSVSAFPIPHTYRGE